MPARADADPAGGQRRQDDVVGVHELQAQLGRRRAVRRHGAEARLEGRRELHCVDAEFPPGRVSSHDGEGGRGEQGVREDLVAEAGAEDADAWVLSVDCWEGLSGSAREFSAREVDYF